jgi:mannose-6-phosphate isomerase-like protein (cupin superfamily)
MLYKKAMLDAAITPMVRTFHLPSSSPSFSSSSTSSRSNRDQAIRNHRGIGTSTFSLFKKCMLTNGKVMVAFLVGLWMGARFRNNIAPSHPRTRASSPTKAATPNSVPAALGSVYRLSDIPSTNTSHTDHFGRPITKQQLIHPFEIPTIAGFSVAILRPGQEVQFHEHVSMHEFFYILEGHATFRMKQQPVQHGKDGEDDNSKEKVVEVPTGTLVHVPPRVQHAITVDERSPHGDMKMLVVGVVIPEEDDGAGAES